MRGQNMYGETMRKRIFEIVDLAGENDWISKSYDYFMYLVILVSVLPLFFKHSCLAFQIIERVTVSIFIVDYVLRWFTSDYKYKDSGKMAFVRYPFSFFAILDLLSILPSLSILNSGFKLFRLLRLNKAFKTLRLLRYSKSFNLIVMVVRKERKALLAVVYLSMSYLILTALIMFQVEPKSFDSFFDAFYWAVVTLTTVGYGDIYPVSDTGKIVSMFSSFMGIAIIALPTGIITAGYMNEVNDK